jgi:uncharacterized protein YrrD
MNTIKKIKENRLGIASILSGKEILNKKVFTSKGKEIGYINDIYFNVEFTSIDAFEITDGLIEDLISGRKIVPLIGDVFIKEEGIFISKEAYEEIMESNKERREDF